MSGVISFGKRDDPEQMWFCSGWGFRAFLDSIVEKNQDDEDLVLALRAGQALNGLHLELVADKDPALAQRLREAIERAARETLVEDLRLLVNGRELDSEEIRIYRDAVAKILVLA
jgi:hypothetical protein